MTLLLLIGSTLVNGTEELVIINEINLSTGQKIETWEFVELKFTDFCLFKRLRNTSSGKGPSLNGYYLFQMVVQCYSVFLHYSGLLETTLRPYFQITNHDNLHGDPYSDLTGGPTQIILSANLSNSAFPYNNEVFLVAG